MDPVYQLVATSTAVAQTPDGWVAETLRDGAVTLVIDDGGLDAINAAARALDQVAVSVLRRESGPEAQEEAVIAFAGAMPLVWVGAQFSERATTWAHERGPMTLLVPASGALPDGELARIARFVTLLSRQTD
jgi:hypothetical protein